MPDLRRLGQPWGIADRGRRLHFWSERVERRFRRRERFCRAVHFEHADPVNFGPAQIKYIDPKIVTHAHTDAHPDPNTDAHPDADAHPDPNSDAYAHANTDAHASLIRRRM
jgi:hypothetical protein